MALPELAQLLRHLDEAFEKQAWHGPNLKGSLRGVTPQQAAWTPAPGRHSIWALTLHAAYWKYAVRRRLTGEKRGSFPIAGSNFFSLDGREWKHDVALLIHQHRQLRAAVAAVAPLTAELERLIRGASMHDIYHAGQITYIKRLFKS